MDATTLLAVLAIFIAFFIRLWKLRERNNLPPGPKRWLWFDNDRRFKKYMRETSGSMHSAAERLCRDYNSDIVYIRLDGENVVFVQNDTLAEEFFGNADLAGRPNSFFIRLRCMGVRQGLSMVDGPLWEEQRSFAVRHLHNLGFGKTSKEFMIHEELKNLFSTLPTLQRSDVLRQRLSKSLLNVLWAVVTGSRFASEAELDGLIAIMEKRAKFFQMSGGTLSKHPWLRFVAPDRSGYSLIDQLNRTFKALIKKTIDEHKRTYSAGETRDFIDAFLHEMNSAGSSSFTDDQLAVVCLDLFIAGSQTTSSSLDFLILRMITHPDVQDRVHREIDSVLRPEQWATVLDRKKMPFTEAVLLESQRFAPTIPVIGPRRALSDTTLGGYTVPKDFTLFANVFPYLRDETKWPNPHNFDPDSNYLNNERLSKSKEDKYFPFGKGKRRCPGDSLAKAFMFIFFVSILQWYKIEISDPDKPPSTVILSGITSSPYPYEMKLIPRK